MLDLAKQIERLQIVLTPVTQLVPDPKNSRTHSSDQINTLCKMIQEYGFTVPLCVADGGKILAGHGRWMAAKRLGIKRLPCVDLSHLTEEQRRAYIIGENRIAEKAGWDTDILTMELGELAEIGFDLALTAWSQKDLEDLLGETLRDQGEAEGDEEPERAPDMMVPLMIEMPRALFQRWKKWRGDRTDLNALVDAITQLEIG